MPGHAPAINKRKKNIQRTQRIERRQAKLKQPTRARPGHAALDRVVQDNLRAHLDQGLDDVLDKLAQPSHAIARLRRTNPNAPISASSKRKRKVLKQLRRAQVEGMLPELVHPIQVDDDVATKALPTSKKPAALKAKEADISDVLASVRVGGGTILGAPTK